MAMPAADGHLVLFGDADVEEAVGEAGLERQQAGRAGHGRRERHHAGPLSAASSRARVKASV